MTKLVDHLVALTGFRDRDQLDATLVCALRDLLRPLSVAIWGCVGESGAERWFRRAEIVGDEIVATSDASWTDFEALPTRATQPLRAECLVQQRPMQADGLPAQSLFPLPSATDAGAVLEIISQRPLSVDARTLVASILRIYHNFHSLLDYSERDTLTGLLNRKTFDESFLKAAAGQRQAAQADVGADGRRSVGRMHEVYLGVVDIDHFKLVNDRHGHLIGDEVLLLLSRLMRNTFRFDDRLYRFGGEEFVVMMRCAHAQDATSAFERLRRNTERHNFPRVGHITVSIGFAEVLGSDTPSTAFQRADTAVYYAKEHGRNQVCSHAVLAAQGAVSAGETHSTGDVELF